jgi:hypothetical protein
MSFCENHAARCELVHIGRGDFTAIASETFHISIAKVIAQDVNDVRLRSFSGVDSAWEEKQSGKCD